jgi:hypothetical protein
VVRPGARRAPLKETAPRSDVLLAPDSLARQNAQAGQFQRMAGLSSRMRACRTPMRAAR